MKTIKVRLPKFEQVQFELLISEEHVPVEGNAIASGDNSFDKQVEDGIIERLNNGDLWAWCTVELKATWKGLTASDYLGACSYKNQKDFESDGYYEDMKRTAFNELLTKVQALA